jgi:hypothetical protein
MSTRIFSPARVLFCDFSCWNRKLLEANKCVISFYDSCRKMNYFIYSISCVVVIRFVLQKPRIPSATICDFSR